MRKNIRRDITLTDGKVLLRPHRMSDLKATDAAIRESLADMSPWLPFAGDNYSLKSERAWIRHSPGEWKKGNEYSFAIVDVTDNTMIGSCGLNGFGHEARYANLGYWVRSSRTGCGIAPAATRLLAEWGFRALVLKRIEIVVAMENLRSQRVAEKAGAIREGILRNRIQVNGKTYDAVMFSLVPEDFQIKPK